jgi:RimJ/RimL family protein N-acetyltransferase
MQVPLIETPRLRLRGHRLDDFSSYAAIWIDPITTRYTSGKPLATEEAWGKMLRNAGFWPVLGYGLWAIEETSSGEFVGEVGFADFKRDIPTPTEDAPELGYILSSRVHGKGYATEAVRAAIDWVDRELAASRTICIIQEGNLASIHVADKCGYREFDRTTYKGNNVIVLERLLSRS